jgi:putative colanic acid biosynthesis UDP-glucose lipid carrier transferase
MTAMLMGSGSVQTRITIHAFEPWQRSLAICLRLGDMLVILLTGIVTHEIRFDGDPLVGAPLVMLVLGVLFAMEGLSIAGSYDVREIDRLSAQLTKAAFGWTIAFGCMLAVLYMIKMLEPISRIWTVSWFVAAFVGLVALRGIGRRWIAHHRLRGAFLRNVAIVREPGSSLERILAGISTDPSLLPAIDVIVDMDDPEDVERSVSELRALDGVEQVVVISNARDTRPLYRLVQGLRHLPMEINLVSSPIEGQLPLIGLRAVGSLPATVLLERPHQGPLSLQKEVFDRLVATFLIVLVLPLLAVIALAIKLDSRGPVIYRQLRFGFDRKAFKVLKFRTMHEEVCDSANAATVQQAGPDDDRVTRVGSLLRRASLDELPQLFNVLRGDMSLVGPRPHAIAHDRQYAELIDGYLGRHRVKPGITGWAQVHGYRGETRTVEDMQRRIEFDLYYIDNWSLALDLRIMLRTPFTGFVHENAY